MATASKATLRTGLSRLVSGVIWALAWSFLAFVVAGIAFGIAAHSGALWWFVEPGPGAVALWGNRLCGLAILAGGALGFVRGVGE